MRPHLGRVALRAGHGGPSRGLGRQPPHGVADVLCALNQRGALFDQRMAAFGLRCVNRAGHGHDLAPQVQRDVRGDERARAQRGLNHQGALCPRGLQPITTREVMPQGRAAQRQLA